MRKIETTLENMQEDIKKFYDPKEWHFLTLNGVALADEKLEVQWIFSKYNTVNDIIVYYAVVEYTDIIPSIADIIPSAIISQREIVDMFGIEVEDSPKGLYLDEDSAQTPLKGCSI